jgi:CRISPR system Cascade subunit CasB
MTERPFETIAFKARRWWQSLQPSELHQGDRASLARLRRTTFPAEAMAEEATLKLFGRLGLASQDHTKLPRIAVIAMVLAHVRKESAQAVMRRVGRRSMDDAESATMSPLRLRRLLACRDDEDLAREMRRLVALAGGEVDAGDLAASLYFWGDNVRARWAFDYFGAGSAAPGADAETAA